MSNSLFTKIKKLQNGDGKQLRDLKQYVERDAARGDLDFADGRPVQIQLFRKLFLRQAV